MQRIAKTEEKTEKIVNEIKHDISTLVKVQDLKHDNFQQLKKTVDKLQKDIKDLENIQNNSNYANEQVIKTRILIRKINKSESFLKWIFNNNER